MSLRRILRIVLSLVVITLFWIRAARQWRERAGFWLVGGLTLTIILLLVVIMELTGARRKKAQRDDVPKHPLGLDS